MSPNRKLIVASAAALALLIPAGCATHHNSRPQTHSTPNAAAVAAMERQMLRDALEGNVQLGSADRLGRSIHDHRAVQVVVRHMEESDAMYAGAQPPQSE